MSTIPEVFVIESLREEDVVAKRLEGELISRILRMGLRQPEYRYVKTRDALQQAASDFESSNYRYLHISTHGNHTHLEFQFGLVSFLEFVDLFGHRLENRRMFISACEAVNQNLAGRILPGMSQNLLIL